MSIQQHSGQSNHHVAAPWLEYDGGMPNSFHYDVQIVHGLIAIPASLYLIPNTCSIRGRYHLGPLMCLSTAPRPLPCSYPGMKQPTCWCRLVSLRCVVQVSIDGHHTDTAVGLETSSFIAAFIAELTSVFISFIHSFISGMHHPL